jgi:hypothetical protein
MLRRTSLDREDMREDVGQLRTIPILATHDLLLLLVVISAGEKMTEDHLRYIDLLSRMLLNGDTIAIILYRDGIDTIYAATDNIKVLDGCLTRLRRTNHRITRIDKNFIEDLVNTRIESDRAVNHLGGSGIPYPTRLIYSLRAADVGVRELKDVLAVSVLLVLFSHYFCTGQGWGLTIQI